MISPMLGFVAYSGIVKLMKRMKSPAIVLKACITAVGERYVLQVLTTLLRQTVVCPLRIDVLEEVLEDADSRDELRAARAHCLLQFIVPVRPFLGPFSLDQLGIHFSELRVNIVRVRASLHFILTTKQNSDHFLHVIAHEFVDVILLLLGQFIPFRDDDSFESVQTEMTDKQGVLYFVTTLRNRNIRSLLVPRM